MSKSRRNPSPAARNRTADHPRTDRRVIVGVVGVVALALAIGGVAAFTASKSPGSTPASSQAATTLPATVTVAEAATMRAAGAFILDVREPGEWAIVHVPGATLIPLGELVARVAEVPRDQPVVVVCHSGNRSAQGRDILEAAGYTNVTSMAGGLTAWQAAGQPTVTGS